MVIRQDVLLDPQRFALTLQRQAVNVLWLTVGLFNQYARALSPTAPTFSERERCAGLPPPPGAHGRAFPAPLNLPLFYATEGAEPPHPPKWDRLLPLEQIAVVPVLGTHTSIIEPDHIGEVGRAVSQALREARAYSHQAPSGACPGVGFASFRP